jgi:anti-sigma factor RsiW
MRWLLKVLRVSHATPDLLSDYLDQRLSPADRQRVDGHIQTCWECRRELQGLQETVYLLRNTPVVPVPRSFALTASLVAPQSSAGLYLMGVRAAVAVAVALMVVVVGDGLGLLGPSQPQVPVISALVEPEPVIRSEGSGPESAIPVTPGTETSSEPQTASAPATNASETGVGPEVVGSKSSGGPFELWPWEVGLLVLLGALVVGALILRPRKQSD